MPRVQPLVLSQRSGDGGNKPLPVTAAPAKGLEALLAGALCVSAAVVLPWLIHPLGLSPRAVLPMHFPVLLAGLLLSPLHAAIVGIMAPALSMGFSGLPTADQTLRMMPELAAYGFVTARMLRRIPRIPARSEATGRLGAMVLGMLVAMVIGRLVYVLISMSMVGAQSLSFYLSVLLIPALPGIAAQLILVPLLAYRMQRTETRSKARK